jgi:hypothetical protein
VEPSIWKIDRFTHVTGGEPEDVTMTPDGSLTLAPRQKRLHGWHSAQVWCLVRSSEGVLYAGTGNEGEVFALGKDGDARLVFDAEEPIAQAMTVAVDDTLIIATSPDGKVYRVGPDGTSGELFDPPETYVWALAWDAGGDLLVATGDPAVLYRVDERGEAKVLLESEERHFRSLVVAPSGDIFLGTAEKAYIYRVSPEGEAYVLYDAAEVEISALAVNSEGVLYAAALGVAGPSAPSKKKKGEGAAHEQTTKADVTVTVTASASEDDESSASSKEKARPGAAASRRRVRGTAIYEIRPDGYPVKLWQSATETVYSLGVAGDGSLLAGIGEPAAVLRITRAGKAGRWTSLEGAQATSLLPVGEGEWAVATSNLGSVVSLGPERAAQGTYTSPVKDARIFSEWGRLRWDGEFSRGSKLVLEVRSGNTKQPGDTWSRWREVKMKDREGEIPSPSARFLQWRARLASQRGATSPVLRSVETFYRQRNLAPEVVSVRLEDPGVVLEPVRTSRTAQQNQGNSTSRGGKKASAGRSKPPTRRRFEKGKQTVSWTAKDPNNDNLVYDLYYRRYGAGNWTPLNSNVKNSFHVFDTTSLPDSRYQVRVVAADRASNAPQEALSGEAESEPFVIDNGPPKVRALQAVVKGNAVEISFEVVDDFSPVKGAEFAVDGGEWTTLNPLDGVADSLDERFQADVEIDLPGEHLLGVRASDQSGNRGAGHVSVEIP